MKELTPRRQDSKSASGTSKASPTSSPKVLLQKFIHCIYGWPEPLLKYPERMRCLWHKYKLMGNLVGIQHFSKLEVADLWTVELAVNEEHGR